MCTPYVQGIVFFLWTVLVTELPVSSPPQSPLPLTCSPSLTVKNPVREPAHDLGCTEFCKDWREQVHLKLPQHRLPAE